MKTQHTQGPWTNDPTQPTIWANDGDLKVATVSDLPWVNGKSDWQTEQANARLIAAAPELLAALQFIATTAGLCAITFTRPKTPENEDLQAIVRAARAAIAKAKGTK